MYLAIIKDKENDEVIWDYISQYPDDTIHVYDLWDKYSSLNGEYKNTYYLKKEVEKYPNLEFIEKDLGCVNVKDIMNSL